jgi:hypothetical protein
VSAASADPGAVGKPASAETVATTTIAADATISQVSSANVTPMTPYFPASTPTRCGM